MNIKYDKNNPVPDAPGIKFSGNASITGSATGISIKTRKKPGNKSSSELIIWSTNFNLMPKNEIVYIKNISGNIYTLNLEWGKPHKSDIAWAYLKKIVIK